MAVTACRVGVRTMHTRVSKPGGCLTIDRKDHKRHRNVRAQSSEALDLLFLYQIQAHTTSDPDAVESLLAVLAARRHTPPLVRLNFLARTVP